jgi:hypothetical protein
VSPGSIATPLWGKSGLPEEMMDGFSKQVLTEIPAGRFGQSEEIAKAALLLASDDSSFVLGEELVVDGGYSAIKIKECGVIFLSQALSTLIEHRCVALLYCINSIRLFQNSNLLAKPSFHISSINSSSL